jgi:hypothetical protein
MSFVIAAPEFVSAAASDVAGIGEAVRAATASALPSTTGIPAAAGDEVSAAVSRVFGAFGQQFQSLSAQSAAL